MRLATAHRGDTIVRNHLHFHCRRCRLYRPGSAASGLFFSRVVGQNVETANYVAGLGGRLQFTTVLPSGEQVNLEELPPEEPVAANDAEEQLEAIS